MRFTEEIKSYLQQFAPAKRLIRFLGETLDNCTSEAEKRQIANTILEKERLVDEIYSLVFRLPVGLGQTIIYLRYIDDMSVKEVCLTIPIAKSTYHTHHKNALKLLKEMRDKK